MPPNVELPRRIYHLALVDEWQDALDRGEDYRRSTLGKSLANEGFIHCSFASQVQLIADLVYRDRDDVVLLAIEPSRLTADVRVENLHGGDQSFPHIYGPIPGQAVVRADPVPVGADGRLVTETLVEDD